MISAFDNKSLQAETMKKLPVLFQKHKKALPGWILRFPGSDCLRLGIFIVILAWIFQGMRYMNWRETLVKLTLDILLIITGVSLGLAWYWALLIAHTLNFCFNGQWFAMFTHMGANGVSADFFLKETLRWAEKLSRCHCIACALAFGSLARGEYKSTSDIDLRLVPAPGEWNFWCCVLLALSMRCSAFVRGYPLDLYVFPLPVLTKKMRIDEPPVLLAGQAEGLDFYPRVVSLEEFKTAFRKKQGLSA